jgi:predicted GNAT family acetyltransferase
MSIEVTDNPALSRYEVHVDGVRAGVAEYRLEGAVATVDHIEVASEQRGRGVASALAGGVLADLRRRGLRVRPRCPFLISYLARHPDEHDLLDGDEDVRRPPRSG